MSLLGVAAWLVAIPSASVFAVFATELLAGLAPVRRVQGSARPVVAILTPAHNEAAGIGSMIERLKPLLPAGARMLVVADNCSDDTADRVRMAGGEVIERRDPSHRGKGYALDFGRAHLAQTPPDCVMILDADCLPEPGSIEALAAAVVMSGRPGQAINLMKAGKSSGAMVEISNFAFMIKNKIRQRGLVRTGGPAIMTGTGMAFPWAVFERLALASGNIVEDLAMTVELARQGVRPMLVEDAHVWSEAAAERDTLTQRTRWEHGYIGTAVRHGLPSLLGGIASGKLTLARLGLNLLVPPFVLLFAIGCLAALALFAIASLGSPMLPAAILVGLIGLSIALLAVAWWREGRTLLTPGSLLRLPGYVLWKIPVYLKLAKGAETQWVRTTRQDRDSQ